jgi:hypothetical protein
VAGDEYQPVAVSRRISAPAHEIFQVLANPARHQEFDGSGMLRGPVSPAMISGAGDVFVMKMYFSELGNYEMNNHVVEYEQDRLICSAAPEHERLQMDNGAVWTEDMAASLERLDVICTRQRNKS